ncbi:hydrocephalus inducing [Echinococcus multilocularis]|uniref:Hydrocephalus inducing n=1 Tax=Echinococcus multilocularis TaxID=6211 RepID=A0A068XTW3_ECHMU|nr:hydrocephalus inducing [Echinococcus multilocularis]
MVTLWSTSLGPFTRNIDFEVLGSSRMKSITISGEFVPPELLVEPSLVDFRKVAFGFEMTKMMKVQNVSAIPISISFNVEAKSLSVSPSQILLEKMDTVVAEITYFASEVGSTDSCIRINMETVGKIFEIPITGRFMTLPKCSSFKGLLPPEKVTHVPLQVYAKVTGVVSVNLEVAIGGAHYNPLVQKSTTFCVHPQEATIPPFGRTEVKVTACADDVDVEISGTLEICVENSEVSPHMIQLRAIGVGNTITIEPEIPLRLSLGQQFESLPQTRAFVVKNCGRRQQRLVWAVENVHCIRKVVSNKKPKEPDYEIQLDPPKFELKPFQETDFSLKVTSVSLLSLPPIDYKGEKILSNAASLLYTRSMEIRFTLKCHTVIGNAGHKRLLQECIVSAVFIKPMIKVVPNPVEFCLLKIPEKDVENAYQSIVITNLAEIETALQVAVDKPCFLIECARPAQSLLTIPVHGEVHFPSLRVENDFLDFGSVENGSEVTKSLLLLNTSPIKVNYRWKLVHGSLRNSQREPLRLLMRSKSQELRTIPATPLVHSSSISNIDTLHITDVFSITPGSGSVPAGESVSTCIEFNAHSDVAARCAAICCVSDGPDYTVDLKGESSTSDCYIKTNEVPFGEILFNEEAIESFHIHNAGKVPSPFYFTWDRNDVNFRMFPTKGEVPGKGVAEITMCVDVPQPREFTVFAKVHLASKQPEQIRVHGKACFPHVVLNLPRINGEPPRDSDLCKAERDFINSQLALDHHSHIQTTFRRYAEERRTGVEEAGIVLLVFGSPQSGQSDLAKLLAQHYDAVHLNLNEFFANLKLTSLKNFEKDALLAQLLSADSIFGLIMSGIGNSKRCETVLKALGKRRMNMFAVTVTREIASISLADARYEEALSKAEKYAFERKVTEYRSMEEWQYDILPDSARQEVDLALAEWKRQQHKESKQLKEFEKEHRRICHLLSTWDIKNQEQNPNEASLPLIDLDAPRNGSSRNSDDNLVGIPHFVVHSKLDVEIMESPVDQVYKRVEDVQRERPNISVVLNKLLPHLPTREEIRRQLGYGPLAIEIPPPITFSVVHRPVKRERCGEIDHCFTIVKPPGLAEAKGAGLLDMPKATEGFQSVSGVSTMTPRSRRTSTSSSSRGKRWQGKASLAIPEQSFCDPSIYRWIVPENGQIQLFLRFTPRGVGNFKELLRFEILRTKEEIMVECQGCCQLPRLVTEPRAELQQVVIFNPTPIPVAWKCEILVSMKETDFNVCPSSGILKSPNEIFNLTVEYGGSSDPRRIAIKRWLRFYAMDTRGLSSPVTIHPSVGVQLEVVDPGFEVAMPKEGLGFGLVRVREETKKTLELRNHGPFKLQYKFHAVLSERKQMDLQKALTINPQSGILLPSQNLNITEVAFGTMVVNTRATEQVTIKNDGHFDLHYSILPKPSTFKARSTKRESSQKRSLGAWGRKKISQGPFVISPASGTIAIGQKQPITVQCSSGPIKAIFDEEIVIQIADKPNGETDVASVPFRLSMEVCSPSLGIEDMASIFEEHLVCQSRNELESLANHGIVGAAYIEDENCFDFGATLIGTVSCGRFRLFNNSKAALDAKFLLRQEKTEKRRRTRRNDSDALEAFNVVPAISRIEPYQSVYVACSFTAKSLGVYSTAFQVLVEEESAPLLKFDLRGKGEIPRVSVEEPSSQNLRGNRYLVFNKDQTSRFIRIRNDGVIPCQVKVDVETTESHVAAFRLSDSEFRREVALVSDCLQTSVNFTLAASESHSLEVAFIPENHKNGGRITGCVKIFLQGNNYEKEVIELCGVASAELTSAPQIHLVDPVLDPLDFEKVNNKNHMSLGNCYVGAPILKHLLQSYPIKTDEPGLTTRLENKLPSFIFAWPRDHPHLEFEPATGDLHPGSSLTVFVKFYSDKPVAYHLAPVRCELIQVLKAEPQMDYSTLTEGMAVDKNQRCSARSAGTPRRRVRGSPKLQREGLSARSNYSQKICSEESAKLDVVNDKTEDEGKRERKFLDLYFTVDCGFVEYLCEVDSIEFVATPLYCKAVKTLQIKNTGRVTMTFRIEKVDNDDEYFEVDISESLILPGKSAELRLTFRPTRSGEHQCSFTLRVPSTAEESTASKAVHAIGRGVSVPIHLQLSKCDYEARQLPADPLWYQAQTLVIVATGTGHKVTRSFEIMNASEDSIELDVQKVDPSDRTMDVFLSETFIRSGHSTNVEVSFLSPTRETKEVCVIFEASGHRVPLLLVGQTREAVVAFDRSHLRLHELPVGREVEEVEHRQMPLRLNVKTGALKCSTTVWLLDDCSKAKQAIPAFLMQCPAKDVTKSITSASRQVVDFPSLRKDLTVLDFGEVFTGCDSTRLIKLVNHSDYEVEFGTIVTSTSKNVLVPFNMTPGFGKVGQLKETLLQIVFKSDSAFRASTQTTNFLGVIAILNGPAFAFNLRGRVTVKAVDISPSQLNFGAQFTQETGLGVITKCLRISNRSPDKPVYVAVVASTLPEFICDFSPQMLEPSSTADAKVTFYPSACKSYESELCFLVNEKVKIKVPARGRGVKLDVEINCGSLMINREREGMSKTPVKLRDGKQVESSVVHLGNLNFMQSSRRTVAIMNKSPSPITITGASVLPKSKALNKVRVNASTSRPNPSDILSLTFLPSPVFASSNRTPDRAYRGSPEDNCLSQPRKDATAQIEVFFSPRDLPIMSFCEEILLQISTTTNPDKCIWIPGFTICGKCTGAKMVSETSAINFGTVVVGSSCCKTVAVSNRGNKSATFVWDEKTLPRHVVSVEPKSGRIQANTSVNFKFTLKPVQVNQELCFENVTCNIEGSKPLRFTLTGLCTASHEVAEVIHFACPVREKDTQSVSLSNPTNSVWMVKPVFTGTEWSGKGLFEILPKGSVDYAITYHPLNMTSTDDVHKGSIFFPFPNGTGLKCHLEGTSNPPDPLKPKTLVEIPCRRKYGLQIDVPNWLSRLQRFHVSWIASNGSNFTFAGPQFIDVPGGVSKKYPLTCEGLSEASTTLKITFSSTETKEYQFVEYQIRAIRPKPEGLIKLKTPLRKPVTYQLGLENPLRSDTVVALHSTLPELMCPPEYKLTAQSKSTINLDFKPWRTGKFSGSLEVNSSDLGLSVYDLNLEALEPLPEKPVKFQTSLGQSDTVTVTISNLSRSRAEFTCKTNNATFRCERSVLVATNSSVELPVTFEPNSLGALEATLKVTSSQAGSFIFPLHGFAKLPTPQGPFLVSTISPTSLTVKNVFSEPIEFTLEVDNTAFLVEYAPKVVNPHKELKILVTLEPRDSSLNFHGKLVVSCNPSTLNLRIQWVFYLKGITVA